MFNFGTPLKMLRKSKNLTQKQLAENIGASESGIQNYELGTRKPTYDMLISLADYFDVSIDYLVGRNIQGSFRAWLASFQDVDTPMGDFAGDVCRCNDYPEEESYDRLLQYFEYKARFYNNPVVVDLFKTAWNFYKSLSYND